VFSFEKATLRAVWLDGDKARLHLDALYLRKVINQIGEGADVPEFRYETPALRPLGPSLPSHSANPMSQLHPFAPILVPLSTYGIQKLNLLAEECATVSIRGIVTRPVDAVELNHGAPESVSGSIAAFIV
jgi:hypothetical protein